MLDYCLTTVWPHKTNHILCRTVYLIELNYIQFNSKCKIVSRSSYSSTRYWNTLLCMTSLRCLQDTEILYFVWPRWDVYKILKYFTLYDLVEMSTRYWNTLLCMISLRCLQDICTTNMKLIDHLQRLYGLRYE